jgi:hypothetical protein
MSENHKPTESPPGKNGSGISNVEELKPTENHIISSVSTLTDSAVPIEVPPSTKTETGFGASLWYNNKKITALWAINQNRNSWINLSDVGWKRIANNSDSAVIALSILGSNALQTNHIVNVREEDGLVKEMYVW